VAAITKTRWLLPWSPQQSHYRFNPAGTQVFFFGAIDKLVGTRFAAQLESQQETEAFSIFFEAIDYFCHLYNTIAAELAASQKQRS
jgi:hypothetical protein